jgi:hypothetical protein
LARQTTEECGPFIASFILSFGRVLIPDVGPKYHLRTRMRVYLKALFKYASGLGDFRHSFQESLA